MQQTFSNSCQDIFRRKNQTTHWLGGVNECNQLIQQLSLYSTYDDVTRVILADYEVLTPDLIVQKGAVEASTTLINFLQSNRVQ